MNNDIMTEKQIEVFQRDGAFRLQNVFEERWLEIVARGIEQNLADPSEFSESLDAGSGRFIWGDAPWGGGQCAAQ